MIQIEPFIAICDTIVTRRCSTPEGQPDLDYIGLIRGIREEIVLSSHISKAMIAKLWEWVADHPEGTVDLMESYMEFRVRSGLGAHEWSELCRHVGRASTINTSVRNNNRDEVRNESSVIPVTLRTAVVSENEAEELFEGNPWMVFVVLMCYGNYRVKFVHGKTRSAES